MKAEVFADYDAFEAAAKPGSVFFAEGGGPDRLWLHHFCPGCGEKSGLRLFGPNHPFWTMEQRDPITLSPSVHHIAPSCGWHGWLRNGEWVLA